MTADLYFVIGIVIGGLSIPPIFGALIERRAPRMAAVMIAIAAMLIFIAMRQSPGTYTIATIPDAFVRVIGDMMN
ncbi:hypothetical protein ACXN5S_02755 [Pseudoroseicyclus sp. H15]